MYKLLDSFFSKILGYEVQIQKIDETTFIVTGSQLSDIPYQGNYISNLLESYGLNQTIVFRDGTPPSIVIDFASKWQESIERMSYKFLQPNVEHWQGHDLNRYATLVETCGFWDSRTKLASNLLLLFNLYPKRKLPRIFATIERGRVSQILTYQEPRSNTVFQKIDGKIELKNLGPDSNTLEILNNSFFAYSDLFSSEVSLEISSKGVIINDQILSEEKIKNLTETSKHIGSTSKLNAKYSALYKIVQETKMILTV